MGNNKTGKIIVFSAASGAGKTTLLDELRRLMPELIYSISTTTRSPREGEIDGVHYNFISVEDFKKRISENAFAEWAEVHGNYYGTSKEFIDSAIEAGKTVVMDIDVYGKVIFDKLYPNAIGIFIQPPSMEELSRRLRGRGTDSREVIDRRLKNAVSEIEFAKNSGKYEYEIVNDVLDDAVSELLKLIKTVID